MTNTNTKTNTLYRFHIGLLTKLGAALEREQIEGAKALIDAAYSGGYTLTQTQGYYAGTVEASWTVEVYGDDSAKSQAHAVGLALDLRELLSQECIGLALLPVSEFTLI